MDHAGSNVAFYVPESSHSLEYGWPCSATNLTNALGLFITWVVISITSDLDHNLTSSIGL